MEEFTAEPIWLVEHLTEPQPAPPTQPLKCLLVEDSRFDRTLLRYSAERASIDVSFVEATTLAEARRQLKARDFDLVLLDRGLPDGNGFDLARELTSGTRNAGVPMIAISGGERSDQEEEARLAGCAEYLAKQELSPEELGRVIGQVVRARSEVSVLAGSDVSEELAALMASFGESARMVRQQPLISRLSQLVGQIRARDDGTNASDLEEMADICLMLWMESEPRIEQNSFDPALQRIA